MAGRDEVANPRLGRGGGQLALFFGEDIFLAIASTLLIKGYLEQNGLVVEPLQISRIRCSWLSSSTDSDGAGRLRRRADFAVNR